MLTTVHTRLQAFTIHMAFSLALFLILAALILLRWYPDEHWQLGGLRGVVIIGAVDVILGPILTLIVYNKYKKSLKLDLLCILVLQLSALAYGTWSIGQGRPMIQVLTHEGVHIITKTQVKHFGVDMGEVEQVTRSIPARVFMELPENTVSLNQAMFLSEFLDEKPLYMRSDLYHPFPPTNPAHKAMLLRQHVKEPPCLKVNVLTHHYKRQGCLSLQSGHINLH